MQVGKSASTSTSPPVCDLPCRLEAFMRDHICAGCQRAEGCTYVRCRSTFLIHHHTVNNLNHTDCNCKCGEENRGCIDGSVSRLKPNPSLVSLTGVFDRHHHQSHAASGVRPPLARSGWLPLPRGLDPPSQRGPPARMLY